MPLLHLPGGAFARLHVAFRSQLRLECDRQRGLRLCGLTIQERTRQELVTQFASPKVPNSLVTIFYCYLDWCDFLLLFFVIFTHALLGKVFHVLLENFP